MFDDVETTTTERAESGPPPSREPNVNDYGTLLKTALKIFDGSKDDAEVFLHNTCLQNHVNPETLEGLTWESYSSISTYLYDMLKAKPRPKRNKEKGTEKEYAPSMHYQQIVKLAEDNGLTRNDVFTYYGPIKNGRDMSRESLDELEAKIRSLIAKPDPFDDVNTVGANVVNEDGEVPALTAKVNVQEEAREALKINPEVFEIRSREHLAALLRERTVILLELGHIISEYSSTKKSLENQLSAWQERYGDACKRFLEADGNASIKTLYGKVAFTNRQADIAYKEDLDEKQKQAWLYLQVQNGRKEALGIEQLTSWKADTEKLKADYAKQLEQYRIDRVTNPKGAEMPLHPILQYRPARKTFSVSPSLDTIEKEAKNEWKADKWMPTQPN
jgi:hypothetical protein